MPGLGDAVVGAGGTPLGDPGGRRLGEDRLDGGGRRLDGGGARGVTDGAEPNGGFERLFALGHRHVPVDGHQHPVAAEHLALMGEVQRRQLDPAFGDEPPHVELGPIGQREHAQVLTSAVARVVEAPQFGTLALGIPLAELVTVGDDALLGTGTLLVAPGAAEHGVEAVLGDGVEQRHRLQRVAGASRELAHAALVDRPLHRGHHQLDTEFGDRTIAELDDLVEVVTGVDVHHRERDPRRPERPPCQVQHDDGVLAAGEQQHRSLALGDHLAQHGDRFVLEPGGGNGHEDAA